MADTPKPRGRFEGVPSSDIKISITPPSEAEAPQQIQIRMTTEESAPSLEGAALRNFKQRNEALQHLVRELVLLREYNKSHAEGAAQDTIFMFAEGAVGMLAFEHFLRAILADRATEQDTFRNLLEKATSKKTPLLVLPWDDQEDGRKKLTAIRNTLMHGNFAQAAKEAGCADVRDYFQRQYAGEIEKTFLILDRLMEQIDPATGRRYDGKSSNA